MDFRCEFAAIQFAVKAEYELWVTAPENTAMTEVLAGCKGREVPTGAAYGDVDSNTLAPVEEVRAPAPVNEAPAPEPAPVVPAPEAEPAPAAPAAPAGGFANCTEARAAGAAPPYAGSPGYSPEMDRDGDGVACE
ncbi:excalibur calcium-binding domain-containing protein [Kocuria aegyptia]|uniref:Excalibur calcium-binding domain-containing protein n=1 Tax=Kocuria aegyptia TaxID=330943 RepID=A0ABP4W7C2_9MICC